MDLRLASVPWSGNSVDMFILCCSIALNLHKFEKRRQKYTYFHKPPNFFVSFLHFQPKIVSSILIPYGFQQICGNLRVFEPDEIVFN